jgi:hypothetical protein
MHFPQELETIHILCNIFKMGYTDISSANESITQYL